jgi:hypothetical protein
LAEKKSAKRRRRDNKEARERDKAQRTGESPAQQAEAVRAREADAAQRDADRRMGLDGPLGGNTAQGRRTS